jgi:hypothetical protein
LARESAALIGDFCHRFSVAEFESAALISVMVMMVLMVTMKWQLYRAATLVTSRPTSNRLCLASATPPYTCPPPPPLFSVALYQLRQVIQRAALSSCIFESSFLLHFCSYNRSARPPTSASLQQPKLLLRSPTRTQAPLRYPVGVGAARALSCKFAAAGVARALQIKVFNFQEFIHGASLPHPRASRAGAGSGPEKDLGTSRCTIDAKFLRQPLACTLHTRAEP